MPPIDPYTAIKAVSVAALMAVAILAWGTFWPLGKNMNRRNGR